MKCPACGKKNEPDSKQRKRAGIVWFTCSKCGSKYGKKGE